MSDQPRDCEHGQLARVCRTCELEALVAQQAQEIEQWRRQASEAEDKYIASVRYADTLIGVKNRHLSEVARQAQEIQDLRARLASALAEREEALLSIGGVQSDLRKAEFSRDALLEALKNLAEWLDSDKREHFRHRYLDNDVHYTPYRVVAAKVRDILEMSSEETPTEAR